MTFPWPFTALKFYFTFSASLLIRLDQLACSTVTIHTLTDSAVTKKTSSQSSIDKPRLVSLVLAINSRCALHLCWHLPAFSRDLPKTPRSRTCYSRSQYVIISKLKKSRVIQLVLLLLLIEVSVAEVWNVLCRTVELGWRCPERSSQRASCSDDARSCSACSLRTNCSTSRSWSPANDDDEVESGDVCRRARLMTSSDNDSTKSSFDTVSLCRLCRHIIQFDCSKFVSYNTAADAAVAAEVIRRLQMVLNAAAHLVIGVGRYEHIMSAQCHTEYS